MVTHFSDFGTMQCPVPDDGFSYGVNCQGVFIRDRDILQDGVYVLTYYFSEKEINVLNLIKFYNDQLVTLVISIRRGFVYTMPGTINFTKHGSQLVTQIMKIIYGIISVQLISAISSIDDSSAIFAMLHLNPEGGMDNMHKSCIEFHFASISTEYKPGKVDCTCHQMFPFCQCRYVDDVSTFEVYMYASSVVASNRSQ